MKKYERLTHTADILVRIYGRDIKELFTNAALALLETIVEGDMPEADGQEEIELSGGDTLQLLIDWLNEILYLFQVEKKLITEVEFKSLSDENMKAVCRTLKKADEKIKTETDIKAVTYHDLNLKKEKGLYKTDIVMDV